MKNPLLHALRLTEKGLWKDALEILQPIVLDEESDSEELGAALGFTVQCFSSLNREAEIDAFLEKAIELHPKNWRVLQSAARAYTTCNTHGAILDGKFERGFRRGPATYVYVGERDRIRALQLMQQAVEFVVAEEDQSAVAGFFFDYASFWMHLREGGNAWRLQIPSDLSTLPDLNPDGHSSAFGYFGGGGSKAPVGAEGNPVYYDSPRVFEEAKNDGERWRWCLEQALEYDYKGYYAKTLRARAEFLQSQFGVQTLSEFGMLFRRESGDSSSQSHTWELHTLAENETLAKLADGVKRFSLPEEHNPIVLYRKIAESNDLPEKQNALFQLGLIFENRRQYEKAAEFWDRLLNDFPLAQQLEREQWKDRRDQILKNWGRFEPVSSKVSGKGADLQYLFRNGTSVQFTAREINVERLFEDVKGYIRTKPRNLDWGRINIENLGYDLVAGKGTSDKSKYLGREVARWNVELQPAAHHFDRRITITTPMVSAGAYLIEARMQDGNTDFIVVWLNDAGIVRKQLDGACFYYVADAESGRPLPGAELEFFGYRRQGNNRNTVDYDIKEIREKTDENGQSILGNDRIPQGNYQWLTLARTPAQGNTPGKFAYLGFSNIWYSPAHKEMEYGPLKAFFISDRPVYRPKDKVEYKFWIARAKYDSGENNELAGKQVVVAIRSPRGETVEERLFTLDSYGGLVANRDIPENAVLGTYSFDVRSFTGKNEQGEFLNDGEHFGRGTLRVEEYKKPEYEVSIESPKEPVALGEPIRATISANYYFGAPVVNATVKYTVRREKLSAQWFPVRPWDWFYGRGYWWFAYDYDWYPGWDRWGCARPLPPWNFSRSFGPPEVVAEKEVQIGPEGTVEVNFETAFAKEMFPNDDQKYTITAEVVDQSRRTIVGSGTVLVAKEPFKVYSWVDRGFYEPNQQIKAHFQARKIDGKPVSGNARIKVYKISYSPSEGGKGKIVPLETEIHSDQITLNETGTGTLSLNAGAMGQYRISCVVKDSSGHEQEGGYVFNVYGPRSAGSDSFEFQYLELIPDKAEYANGEQVRLRINTNKADSTVLLFLRPNNGFYSAPQMVRLSGKSETIEIPVSLKDMPNFFVEALTISDGKVYSECKELVVPPEKRIVNVEVRPVSKTLKPGEKAKAELVLSDHEGNPVQGQTVVSVYDKSVEYISGGSNVADIREFFWKWRRSHYPGTMNNLDRLFHHCTRPNEKTLQYIGIFGATLADDFARDELVLSEGILPSASPVAGRNLASKSVAPMSMSMGGGRAGGISAQAFPSREMGFSEEMEMEDREDSSPDSGSFVEATVRKDFADTAFWVGALHTDEKGVADIEFEMPENLTTWKINVWSMGSGTKVGYGNAEVITRKDLILRMQKPRFLVQKDKVLLSANVHNYLKDRKNVQVSLELEGPNLAPDAQTRMVREVQIEPEGEARIDWWVDAKLPGEAVIRMKALTDEESDAIRNTIPVYVHGMLKQEARSGFMKPSDKNAVIQIRVPEQRRPEQSRLTVRFSPTLAGSMIDALPYLVDYPYGCTEQTLNRFLPTVITQKVLLDMGVDLAALQQERANLNAQELGDPGERSAQWGGSGKNSRDLSREQSRNNPVFDPGEVRKMVEEGVGKLAQMQCSDGGWGWFGGYGEHSSAHLTAWVVRGLKTAQSCDVAISPEMLQRGIEWLKSYQREQVLRLKNGNLPEDRRKGLFWKEKAETLDALVYLALLESEQVDQEMKDFLYRDRTSLSLYGVAMLGIALELEGDRIKSQMCLRMLSQYLVEDPENQTAYLNLPSYGSSRGGWRWWNWFDDEFETHAMFLKLLVRSDPKGDLAPKLVKYLLNNRKNATYWNSTRDTALCVEAFAEFLRASGEDRPEMEVEILFDSKVKKTVKITPQNLFQIDNTLLLEAGELSNGEHLIEIRKTGTGPLYFNTYLRNFTLEDPIEKTGLEVKIERRFYRLEKKSDASTTVAGSRGQVLDLKAERFERIVLKDLSQVKSGDLLEIELLIESKNDYEYLLIEDFKAAGTEPVDFQSGYSGNSLGAYVEFRDNRTTFFVQKLARGKHGVSYRIRAEQPGTFSALPAKIEAMYAPELQGNSDEFKLDVEDRDFK